METEISDVMNIKDLASYLKIPKGTLYRLAKSGKLPGKKIGRHWRFRKVTIDMWLEATVTPSQNLDR